MKLSFFVRYLDQAGIFRTRVELSSYGLDYLLGRAISPGEIRYDTS